MDLPGGMTERNEEVQLMKGKDHARYEISDGDDGNHGKWRSSTGTTVCAG